MALPARAGNPRLDFRDGDRACRQLIDRLRLLATGLHPASLLSLAIFVFFASITFIRVVASRLPGQRRVVIVGCGKEAANLALELNNESLPFQCLGVVSVPGDEIAAEAIKEVVASVALLASVSSGPHGSKPIPKTAPLRRPPLIRRLC